MKLIIISYLVCKSGVGGVLRRLSAVGGLLLLLHSVSVLLRVCTSGKLGVVEEGRVLLGGRGYESSPSTSRNKSGSLCRKDGF